MRALAEDYDVYRGDEDGPVRPFAPPNVGHSKDEESPVELDLTIGAAFADLPRPTRAFLDHGGLIPMKNVTLLAGDGGTGKSLLALQLAIGVSLTGGWLGRSVRDGHALYVSAEDDETELHIRLAEIAEADGFDLANLHALTFCLLAGKDAVLAAEDGKSGLKWTKLFDAIEGHLTAQRSHEGYGYNLVVLDNLADVFAGNENVRATARQFIGKLRGLAIEHGIAIVLLMHPSLSGMSSGTGTSGSTAWSNSVRSRLYLRRDIDTESRSETNPNRRILETMKSNYGPTGGSVQLEWQSGRFLCLDAPTAASNALDHTSKAMRAERVFLEMVRRFNSQDRTVSAAKSANYAPTLFCRHPAAEGVKRRDFEMAMEALFEQRKIEIVFVGSPSRQRQNIVPV